MVDLMRLSQALLHLFPQQLRWFLSAYFLGGYGVVGHGMTDQSKPGLTIRTALSGHIPPYWFIFVTTGSTAVLLIGWRALLFNFLATDISKNDMYQCGSPFELFELYLSLVY